MTRAPTSSWLHSTTIYLGDLLTMKHVLFGIVIALFILTVGQNWGHYASALMIAAYRRHGGDLTKPIF